MNRTLNLPFMMLITVLAVPLAIISPETPFARTPMGLGISAVVTCAFLWIMSDTEGEPWTFQDRVRPWLIKCFGKKIAADVVERNMRFLEEALELVQSTGLPRHHAHQLVNYVYNRPVGETSQEIGGVMVTLAALCLAIQENMHLEGEVELDRINQPEILAKIRAKQLAKPRMVA